MNGNAVETCPKVPLAVFTSVERWNSERIGALALYCSDGRWGDAFDDFCHNHLLIPRYDRWAVPGGPAWLAVREEREDFAQAAREQLDFLVRAHALNRILLITHFGCAVYAHRLGKSAPACLPSQVEDIRLASAVLRRWYPGIRVEGYLAMRKDETAPSPRPLRAEGYLTQRVEGVLSFHPLGV
jgi:hypothetical protein